MVADLAIGFERFIDCVRDPRDDGRGRREIPWPRAGASARASASAPDPARTPGTAKVAHATIAATSPIEAL